MTYCEECGAEISDDSIYCSECGTRVGSNDGVTDILQWSWRTFTDEASTLVPPYAVLAVLNLVYFLGVAGSMYTPQRDGFDPNFAILLFIFSIIMGVIGAVVNTVGFKVASNRLHDRKEDLGSMVRYGIRKLPSLIGAGILSFLIFVAGLIALVIPGLYLGMRLSLTPSSIIIEDKGAVEGMKDSWETAHGNLWTILGVMLVYGTIHGIVQYIPIVGPFAAVLLVLPQLALALGYIYVRRS
ncbi:MAG: glycerophosphoryl diester phosphodiesterase membrane domain-containing protein [Halobacteria archaeon]